MPEREDVIGRNQLAIERLENRRAREIGQMYNSTRREIVGRLLEAWNVDDDLTPTQRVDALRRLALLPQIDSRLSSLEALLGEELRDTLTDTTEAALEGLAQEINLLDPELRRPVGSFTRINEPLVETFLPQALEEAQGIRQSMMIQIRREMQTGLLQGESFPALVRRLMAATPTGEGPAVWRNGQLSAERLARRLVITSANAAKEHALQDQLDRGGTKIRKQAVAAIGSRTTQTCLRVHGQIQDVGDPFILTGKPRFARKMQHPSFHWNCRTSIVMYHPSFEDGKLKTPEMRRDAAEELKKREDGATQTRSIQPKPRPARRSARTAPSAADVRAAQERAAQAAAEAADAKALAEWQPSMSRADAERWAAGSVHRDTVYHATDADNIDPIKADGFDLSKKKFGRIFGNGVYMGEDQAGIERYVKQSRGAGVVQAKINVRRLEKINVQEMGMNPRGWPQADRIKELRDQGVEASVAKTQAAQEAGFDGYEVTHKDETFVVVFDPRRIVVING